MNGLLEIKLIRELARQPKLSLGSIHYCLNALIEKGFIKAKNFKNAKNKLAYSYILTPSGIAHKQKITIDFLKRKQRDFENLKKEISGLKKELADNSKI
jgi:EPS-associated MarR family transcriptional regulator